jgi:MinD-like ATPase involved in chromosome partitioning or flagellar assembly
MGRGNGTPDGGGSTPASDAGSAGEESGATAGATSGSAPGENGAMPGRANDEQTAGPQPPPGLHRPAGFAAGFPGPDQQAYPGLAGDEASDREGEGAASVWLPRDQTSAGAQPSPYASYGDYPPYQEQGYPGYGQPQGYGEDRGYGQEPGYPAPEGYGPGYPSPADYGDPQGYAGPGMYGEGQGYGSYGEGQGYIPGQAYPEGPAYGGLPPGEGQPYGQSYGPARGYPAPPGSEAERISGLHHASGPGTSPYDVLDPYGHGRSRTEVDEAPRPYGSDAGYPQSRATQEYRVPGPGAGETLAPLPAHGGEQQVAETADDLTAEALLHGKRQAPGSGWRRVLYKSTGGLIHPRESAEAVRRRDLIARVRTPVAGGHHRVAVMSLKGGVGKTTTCVSLGSMLASLRGDRIIALDANPDRGTLSDKVRLETAATVRDLLNERDQIQRYADVRAFTSQAPSRLEVLASDRDPAVSVAFSEEDYYDAARVLEHFYSISLTDCGTGLLHSAMAGVLRMADQIVLVSSPSVDGARSASATLDWLDAHEYGDLVRNAVVVLSMVRPRSKSTVDLDRLENHFAGRCRSVARIPYDSHLEEGAEVDLEQMSPATVHAYLMLAATVGDGFAWPRRGARQPGLGQPAYRPVVPPATRRYGWSASGGLA